MAVPDFASDPTKEIAEKLKRPVGPPVPEPPTGPWADKEEYEKDMEKYLDAVTKYNKWVKKEAEWYDGLSEGQKLVWNEAVLRDQEIRNIWALSGDMDWVEWFNARLIYLSKLIEKTKEARKKHCEKYPVKKDGSNEDEDDF